MEPVSVCAWRIGILFCCSGKIPDWRLLKTFFVIILAAQNELLTASRGN